MTPRERTVFGIRRGEGWMAGLFFTYFLFLAASNYAAKSVRQATYIDTLGADKLPWVYLAVALLSFPVLLVYTRLSERFAHHVLIAASCVVNVIALVVFFLLFEIDQAWVTFTFYLWTSVAFGIAVSQLWSFTHEVFDPRQARRLFAFISAGGLLGGVPGGQLARVITVQYGTRFTLLGAAAIMLVVLACAMLIHHLREHSQEAPPGSQTVTDFEDARGGLRAFLGSRLLAQIAALMLLSIVVAQMVDLQFYWAVEQHTTDLDERTSVVGTFFSVMGVLGFIFQLIFTRRIHRRTGVEVGMRVLPASIAASAVLMIIAMGFIPAAIFAAAWALKLSEAGFRFSIDQATRELLYLPVAEQMRKRAKAFIDVFVQRFAKGVAAVVLLPVTFGLMSYFHLAWLTLAVALGWLWLTWTVKREYVSAYRTGLVSGVLQQPAVIDPADLTTVVTLVQSLGSSEPRQVLHSLELLGSHGHGSLVPPLLLHHDDPEVRRKTLDVLAAAGRDDATPLVERAVRDKDPEVRSGAMQTLAVLQGERASRLIIPGLEDTDPRLRATAVANLLTDSDPETAKRASSVLAEMVEDEDADVRAQVAQALAAVKEPAACANLVHLLYDRDQTVVAQAIGTVRQRMGRDGQNPIYLPILISLMGDRRLKHKAREALVACGQGAIAAAVHFMRSSDEQIWVRRAVPKTIALTGTQQAADALLESLDEEDSILRMKIVDALDYLRSHAENLDFSSRVVKRQIRIEKDRYLETLADLWAVSEGLSPRLEGPVAVFAARLERPSLLEELLAIRLQRSVDRLFGLLGLIYPLEDVRAAHRSLLNRNPVIRARALEYLDNSLKGSVRRDVFAVIDDASAEAKLGRAHRISGAKQGSGESTIRRLLSADLNRDPAAVGLSIAAAYTVFVEKISSMHDEIETLATEANDPWVKETARWVMTRLEAGSGPRPEAGSSALQLASKGDVEMSSMARIEMVVFLQRVDLFSFCNAEQVVQLAAIASEKSCTADEVIFRCEDPPDALFCVVEGKVSLRDPEGEEATVRANGRFGVIDILSGRPRSYDAVAIDEGTRLLTIEADDFFDLLSHNIEIVKALFRQVL